MATRTIAYVTNSLDNTVSIIDLITNIVISPTIFVGREPQPIASTPNGKQIYVGNRSSNSVSVIDTISNTIKSTIYLPTNTRPRGIAITPDGSLAYITSNPSGGGPSAVTVVYTSTNTIATSFNPGNAPNSIAITADGTRAYMSIAVSNAVKVFKVPSNTLLTSINVGVNPLKIAIKPDGLKAYVVNSFDNNVTVIDTSSNTALPTPISVGSNPIGIAIKPDGLKAYVTNNNDNTVSVIDLTTDLVIDTINVGAKPFGVEITPDGSKVYVVNENSNNIIVIDSTTDEVTGSPIPVGNAPREITIINVEIPCDLTVEDCCIITAPKGFTFPSALSAGVGFNTSNLVCFEENVELGVDVFDPCSNPPTLIPNCKSVVKQIRVRGCIKYILNIYNVGVVPGEGSSSVFSLSCAGTVCVDNVLCHKCVNEENICPDLSKIFAIIQEDGPPIIDSCGNEHRMYKIIFTLPHCN